MRLDSSVALDVRPYMHAASCKCERCGIPSNVIVDRLLVEQHVIMLQESPNLVLEIGGKVLKVVLVMGIRWHRK
jgi:hypothetical protein